MTLTERAYLEIDDGDGTTATFEFHHGLEEALEGRKSFIMAERGQYVQEVADNVVDEITVSQTSERRRGWWIDGGAGGVDRTISFETGLEDIRWGDGTGGTGASNVTETDASGADVDPMDRRDVLAYWLKRTRTDSLGPQARLHWGQWTDGNVEGVTGVSAAEHGEPLPVAILEWNLPSPNFDESVSFFSGSITFQEIALFPTDSVPSWVSDPATKLLEQISDVNDR